MGKRIITRRRGTGTNRYKAPKYTTKYEYPSMQNQSGIITNLTHERGKSAPVSTVQFEDKQVMIPAPMEVKINDAVSIQPLSQIPAGTFIFAIEKTPGSGPSFCRAAGSFAKVVSKSKSQVTIQFPSKKQKSFHPNCRASIGVVAGGGRREKPIVKAGKKYHIMKAKNKLFPVTSAVARNAREHPFGSGRGRHIGKPKNAPRNAPPGRKVGLISARRTGRKKRG